MTGASCERVAARSDATDFEDDTEESAKLLVVEPAEGPPPELEEELELVVALLVACAGGDRPFFRWGSTADVDKKGLRKASNIR